MGQHGGTEIDIDALVRIADLFRFHWDPPVLVVLAERPFRFRALLTRLESHVGDHVADNALSRSLHRLTRSGLVLAESKRIGQRDFKVYDLSGTGREHLETYGAFIAVYEHLEKPAHGCDGCCLHSQQNDELDQGLKD